MEKGEERRRAPSYVVSALLFWGLYTALWYSMIVQYDLSPNTKGQGETVYYIVVPLIGFLGFVANLAFEWTWNRMTMGRRNRIAAEGTAVPLIDEAADEESLRVLPTEGRISKQAQAKKPRQTVDYINNIKIFLTFIVILHHCAAPFSAL